jgi:hypothetical protein
MMLRVPSIITRYSFTVLAVTLSTLFRFALDPLLDLRAPFILYFPTVLLCAHGSEAFGPGFCPPC